MEKDAIEKDVSSKEKQEDPRESLIESILTKNDSDRQDYDKYMGDPEPEPEKEPEKEPEPVEEKKQDEPPAEEMIEIVVDGEKQTVPLSKILDAGKRSLQKESAADKRLEEATRLLNEAKVLKDTKEPEKAKIPDDTKEIMRAINYGTDEEAEAAIAKLMERTKESVTPEKIEELVKKKTEEVLTAKEIFEKFHAPEDKGGFGDLMEDPYLQQMAIAKTNELLAKGGPNTWETYQKAGEEVRAWVGKFKKVEAKPTGFEEKLEKKKTIDPVKGATAIKANNEKEKPETASDVIAAMRKARPGGEI